MSLRLCFAVEKTFGSSGFVKTCYRILWPQLSKQSRARKPTAEFRFMTANIHEY